MRRGQTRRTALRGAAVVGSVAVAGCSGGSSGGGPTYKLQTNPVADSLPAVAGRYAAPALTDVTARHPIDYPESYKQQLITELFETGSVTAPELQFAFRVDFGTETRPYPRFAEREDGVYQVVPTGRTETTEQRWAFYLDHTASTPDDGAQVVSSPPSSLSERDRQILAAAADNTAASRSPPLDADDTTFPYRGVTYHRWMDPEASALVPDPPFDILEREGNYFAARAERGTATVRQFSTAVERVADDHSGLVDYVDTELVDARFDPDSLSAAATDVLDTATAVSEGRLYTESGGMSDALTTITDRLGMQAAMPETPGGTEENPSGTSFDWSLCRYDGGWYEAALTVR